MAAGTILVVYEQGQLTGALTVASLSKIGLIKLNRDEAGILEIFEEGCCVLFKCF